MSIRILIGGDVCPVGRNERVFCDPQKLAALHQITADSDLVIVNLECPLYKQASPIVKGGPVLGASVDTAVGLAAMGVHVVGLANNHILDHGVRGLASTLAAVQAAGIKTVGAGTNLHEAGTPLMVRVGQTQLAIAAFAEREYSYATPDSPGACPLDLSLVVRTLRNIPHDAFTVVLVHGGNEHFPFPNPRLQDTCRLMVELGATAVVCQHSHCIGSYERYLDGLIVYGQGNFLFDRASRHASWWEGILVALDIEGGSLVKHRFIPVKQTPGQEGAVVMCPSDGDRVLADLEQRMPVVTDPARLLKQWRQFCRDNQRSYQSFLFGYGRLGHVLNKLTGMADWRGRSGKMNIGNVLRCASHLEALRTIYSREATTGDSDDER